MRQYTVEGMGHGIYVKTAELINGNKLNTGGTPLNVSKTCIAPCSDGVLAFVTQHPLGSCLFSHKGSKRYAAAIVRYVGDASVLGPSQFSE